MKFLNWTGRAKLVILFMALSVSGCAILNQPSPIEIPTAQLQCEVYPRLVDGNMGTSSILKVEGSIKKEYINTGLRTQRYQGHIQGTNKVHVLIQLNSPKYVTHIEIYPVSKIPSLAVDTATARVEPGKGQDFTRIPDNRRAKSENASVIRVNIEQEVLFLQLTISSERDSAKAIREGITDKIQVPFKDIVIREVKFYGE